MHGLSEARTVVFIGLTAYECAIDHHLILLCQRATLPISRAGSILCLQEWQQWEWTAPGHGSMHIRSSTNSIEIDKTSFLVQALRQHLQNRVVRLNQVQPSISAGLN